MKLLRTPFNLVLFSILLCIFVFQQAHANINDSCETAVVNSIINFDIQRLTGVGELDRIVIDAGHGGKDHGCSGAHSKEKFIVLDIAKKLGVLLKSYHPEIEVMYTRETDVFIPLDTRIQLANKNKADLFISIHANYIGRPHVHGTETYVMGLHRAEDNLAVAKRENSSILYESDYQSTYGGYDPNSPEAHILLSMFQNAYLDKSINFATKVEDSFINRTPLKSRGVKQAGFLVLRKATMPSALIETGFLSSRDDEAYLMSATGQDEVANAILKAITQYKREINGEYWTEKSHSIAVVNAPQDRQLMLETTTVQSSTLETNHPNQKVKTSTSKHTDKQQLTTNNEAVPTHPKTASGATGIANHSDAVMVNYEDANSQENIAKRSKNQQTGGSIITLVKKPNSTNKNQKIYRIQIAAGKNKLITTNDPKFSTISDLIIRKENDMFKYLTGAFTGLEEAYSARELLVKQGFKGAFIVAYDAEM